MQMWMLQVPQWGKKWGVLVLKISIKVVFVVLGWIKDWEFCVGQNLLCKVVLRGGLSSFEAWELLDFGEV